jgi:hypothetical protein
MKAQRGSTGITLLIPNLGARWEFVINAMPRHLYPRKRNPVLVVQEAGWAPGLIWTHM